MKVETTNELVLKAAQENPSSRAVLITLFPSVFEDMRVLCEIGSIFFRRDYPNNIYSVQKRGGILIVLNISHCTVWKAVENIQISDLSDDRQQVITVGEFKRLTGYSDLERFIFVPKGMNVVIGKMVDDLLDVSNE